MTNTDDDESANDCDRSQSESLTLSIRDGKQIFGSSKSFNLKYYVDYELFKSSQTAVHVGRNRQTQLKVAVKFFKVGSYKDYLVKDTPKEVVLQKRAEKISVRKGKGTVLKVLDWYVYQQKYIFVTEYNEDFESLLNYKPKGSCQIDLEKECKYIFKLLFKLIRKINKKGIYHLDLKAENVLYNKKTKEIKLIDFGHAISTNPGKNPALNRACGTPGLITPEQAKEEYFYARDADIWGVGQTVFYCLQGKYPFKNDDEVIDKELELAAKVSKNCKDFFVKLFAKKVEERMRMRDILHHPWLK